MKGLQERVFATGYVPPVRVRFVDEQDLRFEEQAVAGEIAARRQNDHVSRHDCLDWHLL